MPALILFGRKWLMACDDLVIPFAIEAFLKIAWLVGTSIFMWKSLNFDTSCYVKSYLYVVASALFISSSFSVAISVVSSKGAILEVEKRKSLKGLMYIKFCLVFVDCCVASFGLWLLFHQEGISESIILFIKITSICTWIYILICLLSLFISYNSLGSSKFWDLRANSSSLKFFRRAERIWRLRLKFFCCCADIGDGNDFIYVEISTFLASFLNEIDLVPTDILAGIISLSAKHAVEKRRKKGLSSKETKCQKQKDNNFPPPWMTMENAAYFLRIAKSTYGWLAFLDLIHPWHLCSLVSLRCCFIPHNPTTLDNCCHCNVSAVQKITGFSEENILYSSFENSIYEPAFYIAVDHNKKCIMCAIRGTMSFSDLVTDIDADVQLFPAEYSTSKFKCHRGFLRSALFLHKKINDLQIFEAAIMHNPSYNVVLTGHSLGGSIAAILGLLLRSKYPELQCYIYAPMASVSIEGLPETFEFIFTVVVGDDVVPCLSVESCKVLRSELIKALENTNVPKHKILTRACWYHIQKHFKKPKKRVLTEIYDNQHFEVENKNSEINYEGIPVPRISADCKLYAPGRILYFDKIIGHDLQWVTGEKFQNMRISKTMLSDHQPRKIQCMLEQAMKQQKG